MKAKINKVMSAKEAIAEYVHNGDELAIGNYTVGTCAALVYEVTRQHKKGLTVYSQSGIFDDCITISKTEEIMYPLVTSIPLQIFAYYSAIARGLDPDEPRNLAKSVTVKQEINKLPYIRVKR